MCFAPKIDASAAGGALSPDVSLPDSNSGAVRVAGDELRRRRSKARGFASTLLTAGVGGSTVGAAPIATKILLGS